MLPGAFIVGNVVIESELACFEHYELEPEKSEKLYPAIDWLSLDDPRPWFVQLPCEKLLINETITERAFYQRIYNLGTIWLTEGRFLTNMTLCVDTHLFISRNQLAAWKIQRVFRMHLKKRNNAARVIQKGCAAWIDKPITRDRKTGIACRILLRKVQEFRGS